MPGLVHKLVIFAAVDGLILQPLAQRHQGPATPIKIEYRTRRLTSSKSLTVEERSEGRYFEAHGIVGLLRVSSLSYLISITRRQQVAQIQGRPVYVITGVAITPLSSQAEASKSIEQTKEHLLQASKDEAVHSDSSGNNSETSPIPDESDSESDVNDDRESIGQPQRPSHNRSTSSVAEDVISKKGFYGRFAESWLSKKGWDTNRRRSPDMSPQNSSNLPIPDEDTRHGLADESDDADLSRRPSRRLSAIESEDLTTSLVPKLLRTTKMLLTSTSFFFSYEYDITRRLGNQMLRKSDVPIHRDVDPLFFWNQYLVEPFVREGHHGFVLPIMQGFVGQRLFTVDTRGPQDSVSNVFEDPGDLVELQEISKEGAPNDDNKNEGKKDFLVTLVSRRSVKRPGLRYLRRGVDDVGNTANTVETEQILSTPSWTPSSRMYSFVQVRGSIPLYFSQSPYSFKPIPVLHHSATRNQDAFHRHFLSLRNRYGDIMVASLVDKRGGEAKIGKEYEKYVKLENDSTGQNVPKIGFEWFDFHSECRGMKFENVSHLLAKLEGPLKAFGETVELNGIVESQQSGVVRTNCMDCLDRTNVVESALAQRSLQQQLQNEGVKIDLQDDPSTRWFNTLWADNGDAISRQYSSTAALKGDFTRTRKRNYRGALNDFGLTLTRYYNNIVNDYFSQAALDFLLGNVDASVFEEFESTMMSSDPGVSLDRVRENAIDICLKVVISDRSEEFLAGWTLLSPQQPNTLRTLPLEETVVLLTDSAIYSCKFDWNTEKVILFQRVELTTITGLRLGTYITSTNSSIQTNPNLNVGLVVIFKPGKESIMRVNTRSLQSSVEPNDGSDPQNFVANTSKVVPETYQSQKQRTDGILAFKALPGNSSFAGKPQLAKDPKPLDLARSICEDIERAIMADKGGHLEKRSLIEESDIISLADARKRTGLLESTIYSLKRLVWT